MLSRLYRAKASAAPVISAVHLWCLGAVMAAMYSRLARSMVERIDHLHAATRGDGRDGHQLHRLQPLHHFMWVRAG